MAKETTARRAEVAPGLEKQLPTVEELFEKHQTPRWVQAGVRVHYRWAQGKRIAEQEFLEKVEAWRKGPMA